MFDVCPLLISQNTKMTLSLYIQVYSLDRTSKLSIPAICFFSLLFLQSPTEDKRNNAGYIHNCDLCHEPFKSRLSLKKHMKVHTGYLYNIASVQNRTNTLLKLNKNSTFCISIIDCLPRL